MISDINIKLKLQKKENIDEFQWNISFYSSPLIGLAIDKLINIILAI